MTALDDRLATLAGAPRPDLANHGGLGALAESAEHALEGLHERRGVGEHLPADDRRHGLREQAEPDPDHDRASDAGTGLSRGRTGAATGPGGAGSDPPQSFSLETKRRPASDRAAASSLLASPNRVDPPAASSTSTVFSTAIMQCPYHSRGNR